MRKVDYKLNSTQVDHR